MLSELYIRDFAIIDEVRLSLTTGFNVLTGETGAGKSIILDAIMLLMGGRADKSFIRAECDVAYVEGMFHPSKAVLENLQPILEDLGLLKDDGELLLTRELRATGRSMCRINGRTVNTKLLQAVGSELIDIHGQGSHLGLLQSKSHLPLLDGYANVMNERSDLAQAVLAVRSMQSELKKLITNEAEIQQRLDLMKFQLEEITSAELTEEEEALLKEERNRLANSEQLAQLASVTRAGLIGMDDESPSAISMLEQVEHSFTQLARLDDSQESVLEQVRDSLFQLQEVVDTVEQYHESLEFNPTRLEEVESRIEEIQQLKRKYGESIPDILALGEKLSAELEQFENSSERKEELAQLIDEMLHEIGTKGIALSEKRQMAADILAQSIETELGDLRMTARFAVDFQRKAAEDGAYVGDERFAFDPTGIDQVEFLLSTNPGEPLKPMAKVASGGETARIMLALKTALARVDATPTLIFDEIDQGIGGRIGDTVGRKLWELSASGEHQVLVVTHLPQLAGYGDCHYHVRKGVDGGRTRTKVATLQYDERVAELAEMIGTADTHAIGGAKAMLQQSEIIKEAYSV